MKVKVIMATAYKVKVIERESDGLLMAKEYIKFKEEVRNESRRKDG